ncbi:MAG: hypothetical protein Unbinned4234contig1003_31 [Prokaryotic dsDNA virus sp.]|nr:MAG: hypothetical protein Unbinned4234contig1003_31 [Prokaryotic dsDNA virus sp.]|tara:strand:+ start:4629 stop:7565 length:2937 start_codon:yes stop_codon:yes gene_type:complete
MITVPAWFELDIERPDTNLIPFVIIEPLSGTSLGEDSIFMSIQDILIPHIYGGGNYEFKPLLLNIPSFKESIDILKRKHKINAVNLTCSNYDYNGKILSKLLQDVKYLNATISIGIWSPHSLGFRTFVNSSYSPEDAPHGNYDQDGWDYIWSRVCPTMFIGRLKDYTYTDKHVKINIEDLSLTNLKRELPLSASRLGTEHEVPDKYKNKYKPIVYGLIDRCPTIYKTRTTEGSENIAIDIETDYKNIEIVGKNDSSTAMGDWYIDYTYEEGGIYSIPTDPLWTKVGEDIFNVMKVGLSGSEYDYNSKTYTIPTETINGADREYTSDIINFTPDPITRNASSQGQIALSILRLPSGIIQAPYNVFIAQEDEFTLTNMENLFRHTRDISTIDIETNFTSTINSFNNDANAPSIVTINFNFKPISPKVSLVRNFPIVDIHVEMKPITSESSPTYICGSAIIWNDIQGGNDLDTTEDIWALGEFSWNSRTNLDSFVGTDFGYHWEFLKSLNDPNVIAPPTGVYGVIERKYGLYKDTKLDTPSTSGSMRITDVAMTGANLSALQLSSIPKGGVGSGLPAFSFGSWQIPYKGSGMWPSDEVNFHQYDIFRDTYHADMGMGSSDVSEYGVFSGYPGGYILAFAKEIQPNSFTSQELFTAECSNEMEIKAQIGGLAMYQMMNAEGLIDKEYFLNIQGRRESTEEYPSAKFIIKDLLEDIEYDGIVIDESSEYNSLGLGFAWDERISFQALLEKVISASGIIARFDNMGRFKISDIPDTSTSQYSINKNNVIDYEFKQSNIDLIKNRCDVLYRYSYPNQEFSRNSLDLLKQLDPNNTIFDTSFGLTAKFLFPQYKFDYYGFNTIQTEVVDDDRGKMIRSNDSALKFACFYLSMYCNRHLIIKLKLSLAYFKCEVGDIVSIEMLDDTYPYGINYTISTSINGQSVYPTFIITSTNKRLDYIEIEVMQLHQIKMYDEEDILNFVASSGT